MNAHTRPTLMVHTGGIGDFLLTCPALQSLARDAPVHLAGHPDRLQLAVAAGLAQAAHDLDAIDFPSLFTQPSTRLTQFLRHFDRAIVWMRDDDHKIRQALQSCGVPHAQAFPGLPPDSWTRHASEYYLECLGYPPDPNPFRLAIPATTRHDVIIHPGSGGQRKNWPLENFIALAQTLQAQGRKVTWSTGPAEEAFDLPLAPRTNAVSLLDLAGHLAGVRLYIGNDSGITHLAAAVGAPTIAIFGPTNPRVWAPRGSNLQVIQGTPWPELPQVLATISR